ncbi:MAG: type IV secretory system conjugative DNA transfer family protein [Actinomycetota bacterium]|nr:type IV secretory system conjugative DNA transfer family protein [Actinomycetota bacterium]
MTTTHPTIPTTGPPSAWWWAGIPLGWINGHPYAAGPQHCVLVIGPPRSGKTTGVVIPTIITAPAAVVATSTKPDIVSPTLPWRAGRGTCWYFDPSGTTTPPPGTTPARWSPIAGCEHWDTALARAHALTTAAISSAATSLDGGHWTERGEALLAPLLHAAASIDLDISWVLRWVLRRELTEPLRALGATLKTELAKETLVGIAETDERERSGIFSTAARILAAYRHQHALEAAAEPNFNPQAFVCSADTLYLVAPSHHQAQLAPIVVCLLDQIRHATYTRAGNPPPVVFALDEVANIAPLPDLPAIVAEGASQGLITLACLQDLHQARTRWGPAADGFVTLFAAKIALGGIADRDTLTQLSYLAGTQDVTYRTRNGQGLKGGWSQTIQQRPAIPPEQINTMAPGIGYLAHSNHPPHYISLVAPPPPRPRRKVRGRLRSANPVNPARRRRNLPTPDKGATS